MINDEVENSDDHVGHKVNRYSSFGPIRATDKRQQPQVEKEDFEFLSA